MKIEDCTLKEERERAVKIESKEYGTQWIPRSVIITLHRKPTGKVDIELEKSFATKLRTEIPE